MPVKRKRSRIKRAPKNGRPEKAIDESLLKNLCMIQCTEKEMCAVLEVDPDTLQAYIMKVHKKTFSEYYEIYKGQGRVSLRRLQFRKAEEGNVSMLIWLGKQYLDQKDGDLDLHNARACHTFTLKYDTKQALIDQAIKTAKEHSNTIDVEPIEPKQAPSKTILRKKTDVIDI